MIDREKLQAVGLAPGHAECALQALAAGDTRGFVHELLLDGLWSDVADESQPQPRWIERWRTLGAHAFPLHRHRRAGAAARRRRRSARPHGRGALGAGVDPPQHRPADRHSHDRTRLGSTVAGHRAPGLRDAEADGDGTPAQRLHALRSEVGARDPSGRHGEPHPLALRQWRALPEETQARIRAMVVHAGRHSPAAALWKRHVGGELRVCLDTMKTLHRHWGRGDRQKG